MTIFFAQKKVSNIFEACAYFFRLLAANVTIIYS